MIELSILSFIVCVVCLFIKLENKIDDYSRKKECWKYRNGIRHNRSYYKNLKKVKYD